MKPSIPAAVHAAKVAASVIELICRSPKFSEPGQPHQYRSPEQIALILDMVNTAMDAVLSTDIDGLKVATDGETEFSVVHDGNIEKFRNIDDVCKFIYRSISEGRKKND